MFATASPRSAPTVKTLGARVVVDYNSPTAVKELHAALSASQKITRVLDCIGTIPSSEFCAKIFNGEPGSNILASLLHPEISFPGIEGPVFRLCYTAFGRDFDLGPERHFPASEEDKNFAAELIRVVERLVREGRLRGIGERRVLDGGLYAVDEGVKLVRSGKVRGKLVVRVGDTEGLEKH